MPIGTGEPIEIILDVGTGQIGLTERALHIPMPVGAGAVAEAIDDAEYRPGEQRCCDRHEMEFARSTPDPTGNVEQCDRAVHDNKRDIEDGVPHWGSKMPRLQLAGNA